eukprot:Hpha_TRINITY_DN200_c0_g1::TRINITY_DN200_c0_g1_i1::g.83760::m.83760
MLLSVACLAVCASTVATDLIGSWITNDGSRVVFRQDDDGAILFEQDGIFGSLSVEKHTLPTGAEDFVPDFTAQLRKEEGDEVGRLWMRVTGDEMEALFEGHQTVHRSNAVRRGAKAESPVVTGDELLDKNTRNGEVAVLRSGVQYRVLREGSGKQHPSDGCTADVHFEARTAHHHFAGGGPYDNTFQRGQPVEILIGGKGVLPGLDEALRLMVQGDEWEIFIPPTEGYSDVLGGYVHAQHPQAPGWIYRAKLSLVLRVNLVHVGEGCKGPAAKRCWVDTLAGCDETDVAFIQKHKGDANEELRRLLGVLRSGNVASEQRNWSQRRVGILRRLGAEEPGEEAKEKDEQGEEDTDCDSAGEDCPAGAPKGAAVSHSEEVEGGRSTDEL